MFMFALLGLFHRYFISFQAMHLIYFLSTFKTMAVNLHDGRFDCPDRLFLSIQGAWHSCNNSMTDVKELIPGMLYAPAGS